MLPLPVHTIRALPGGDGSIVATLREMVSMVKTWRLAPVILQRATRLVRSCPEKNWRCEVAVLHAFVRDRVRYQMDVNTVETLRTPELVLQERAGDCDDKSVLLASLLEATGHPARFIALAFGPPPAPYSHVLVETRLGDEWIALETTERKPLGWKPQGATRVLPFYV